MQLYFKILNHGRPYISNGIAAVLLLLLYNLFSAASLAMVIPFLEILFSESLPPVPTEILSFSNPGALKSHAYYELGQIMITYGKPAVLGWFCLVLSICIFLKSLFRYLSSWNIGPLEQGIIYQMRKKIFGHISGLSLNFYTSKRKGDIINIIVSDVQVVQECVIGTIQTVVSDPLTMITFLLAMLYISWKLTLFTLIVLPLTGILINYISKSLKRKAGKSQEKLGALIAVLDEFIQGIRIVKSFNAEEYERNKYDTENKGYTKLQVSVRRRSDLASPLTEVLSILVVVIIILYGGNMIISGAGELKPSEFIGFIAFFSQFIAPIKTFSSAVSRIQKGIASYERIEVLLNTPVEVKEDSGTLPFTGLKKSISVQQLGFSYGSTTILDSISLEIKKGSTVALVGPSGAGKSTLADLVARFYNPVSGKILFDDIPLEDYHLSDIRNQMGIVSQEGILFNDSILNNIAYGKPGTEIQAVEKAAKMAHAHEFIAELPQGFHTMIGERGTKLSGGQRQRIAIARALFLNPSILILDEATSALDNESERLVQEALEALMKDRTSLVIAHRLSTIRNADTIVVLDKGKIVESGTHTELLSNNGLYKYLYETQFRNTDAI